MSDQHEVDRGGATPRERQIIEASRHLAGCRIVVIGSGAAFAVAPLAKLTTATDARFVLDSGAVDVRLRTALVSVADPRMPEALRSDSMSAVFRDLLAGGRVDASIMSAAQIDADTGDVLPVAPVYGDVVVNQLVFKPGSAVTPVHAQFVNKTTGSNLPAPV